LIVTCTDSSIDDTALVRSANTHNLPLIVLKSELPWTTHMRKFQLVNRFLTAQSDPEALILYIDAFDVALFGSATEIIQKYEHLDCPIVFGAESNFHIEHRKAQGYYLEKYPQNHAQYNYLNAGTFIGPVKDLKMLFDDIIEKYQIKVEDESDLHTHLCDQSLFSQHYVDISMDQHSRICLDHQQTLFACTGGRLLPTNWMPSIRLFAFLYFRKINRRLKNMGYRKLQVHLPDYEMRGDRPFNKLTNTNPPILHCPGAGHHFDDVLSVLRGEKPPAFSQIRVRASQLLSLIELFWEVMRLRLWFSHKIGPLERYVYSKKSQLK
jgi:hypothetical protein